MRNSIPFILAVFFAPLMVTATVFYNDGGIHDIDYVIDDSIEIRNNFWNETTTVNLEAGGYVDEILGYEDSEINIRDGQIGDNLYAGSNLYSYGSSRVYISGGNILRFLITNDDSQINLSGGEIGKNIQVYDNSQVVMSGGIVNEGIQVYGFIQILDGDIGQNINIYAGAQFQIYGGNIENDIIAFEDSDISLFGGEIGRYLAVESNADVTIMGMDFVLDGHSIFGFITNPREQTNYGHLTGLYLDGATIDIDLKMSPGASILLIPEPITLLLLGIGFVFIRKYRP